MTLQDVSPPLGVRDQDYPAGGRQLLHAVEVVVVVVFVFQWLVWVERGDGYCGPHFFT